LLFILKFHWEINFSIFYFLKIEIFSKASFFYSNNYDFVPFALPSRYRPVTVTLPSRYRPVTVTTLPWPTVGHRYIPLLTVTDRYRPFPIVTKRYMRYRTLQALQSVTERYRTLQNVTERYRTLHILSYKKLLKWTVSKLIYCLSIKLLFSNMFISFFI